MSGLTSLGILIPYRVTVLNQSYRFSQPLMIFVGSEYSGYSEDFFTRQSQSVLELGLART